MTNLGKQHFYLSLGSFAAAGVQSSKKLYSRPDTFHLDAGSDSDQHAGADDNTGELHVD
jgi:hypothetical protein